MCVRSLVAPAWHSAGWTTCRSRILPQTASSPSSPFGSWHVEPRGARRKPSLALVAACQRALVNHHWGLVGIAFHAAPAPAPPLESIILFLSALSLVQVCVARSASRPRSKRPRTPLRCQRSKCTSVRCGAAAPSSAGTSEDVTAASAPTAGSAASLSYLNTWFDGRSSLQGPAA